MVIQAACAHAVVVSVLTAAEVRIAAWRLAGARPRLAPLAGNVYHEDLRQLCRDELGVDVRHRQLGYPRPLVRRVVAATPLTGELRRGPTIPWRVVTAQIAGERCGKR